MTPSTPATTDSGALADWRYEIQHGPDGEAIYAWVYDANNNMVCTAKTHYAIMIVAAPQQQPPQGFEAYRETVRKVATAREKGYAAARANLQEAWAALTMIRETVETLAPSSSVKAAEHLDGPTFMHEADALVAGILALAASQQSPRLEREGIAGEVRKANVHVVEQWEGAYGYVEDAESLKIADAILTLLSSNMEPKP